MKKLIVIGAFLYSFNALASDCPIMYYKGVEPSIQNVKEICSSHFVVQYSPVLHIPVTSAEHLTSADVLAAKSIPRKNTFHTDPTGNDPTVVSDYTKSGFDRGHMSPDADMPNAFAQNESFSLANMTPQTPSLNRVTWRGIEDAVRKTAVESGDVYIVTGAIASTNSKVMKDDVRIPEFIYKAVLVPSTNTSHVYVAPNDDTRTYKLLQLQDFISTYKINPFPAYK